MNLLLPSDEYWLTQSNAQKVLYLGDDQQAFYDGLIELKAADAERFQRLLGISNRLQMVEELAQNTLIRVSEHWEGFTQDQLERIARYLATTCIDVAAGRASHKTYPEWLTDSSNLIDSREALQSSVNSILEAASTNGSVAEFILQNESLFKRYQESYGVVRNFRRLINSQPLWLREYLTKAYCIVKGGDAIDCLYEPSRCDWLRMDSEARLRRVVNHFLTIRNSFTHTIQRFPTNEDNGVFRCSIEGRRYSFNDVYEDDDLSKPVKHSIGVLEGIAESNIIYLVAVVELRQWIKLIDTEYVIERFFARNRFRRDCRAFLTELESNFDILRDWSCLGLLSQDTGPDCPFYPLRHVAADTLVSHIGGRFDSMWFRDYLHHLRQLNSKITELVPKWNRGDVAAIDQIVRSAEVSLLLFLLPRMRADLLNVLDHSWYY